MLNSPFPGFVLFENNQICNFYVILWKNMGPVESRIFAAFFIFLPGVKRNDFDHFFDSEEIPNGSWQLQFPSK